VVGSEFIAEAEDAVGVGFGGVEIVFRAFEGSEIFNREVFWKAFDREAGKIVEHSIGSWGRILRVFICNCGGAD